MYLKEIKASGFKSFADKISINLDNDITCIVGPNGSGKSNIVDAVKWVLGEQSVKSLRGSNTMTDVIFSGSKSRNGLNVASVSLIFDNSDSYLKVPTNEVSITRKVFRTGENEYYLNEEKCRLKDISDLFLDSGMGKYAFNIISQGEIEKIISDSAHERRIIFEEAAGVLKYKKRKEEALRKLDKTNENLTRVKDIVAELELQLVPLKDQSTKAKSYLDAKEKLEGIEIALIANDLDNLNREYEKGTKSIEELQNSVVEISTKSTNSDITLDSKKQELNTINTTIVALNNKYLELAQEEERLNGEKNIIKERSKYDKEDSKVHDNIANLTEQKLLLNNKLVSLKTDIDILNNKLSNFNNDLEKENSELKSIIETRNKEESKLSVKRKELTDIEYKIRYLTDFIENGGSTPSSVKKVLSNPKLKGIRSTISRLIEIEDKYAMALEVSLGGAKDYVVVDNPTCAKEAINYLKENNIGRVTFYPMDVIKPRVVDSETLSLLKNEPGFIDIIGNLCTYNQVYRDIIFNQLGNVILVDNIDNANNISKKIYNRYKIVTLEGEVINVGGSITGGTVKTRSIISEKYELQNLEKEQELIKNVIITLEGKVKLLERDEKNKQVRTIEIEKEKLLVHEEINNKKLTYDKISKDYENITFELSNLDDLINDNLETEEEKIIKKYYEVLSKKENLEKETKEIMIKKDKVSQEVEQLQADFRINNNEIRDLETNLKEQEIKNTKMSVKMDNLLNILSDNYEMTFEKAKANFILEIDEKIARKTVNELRSEIKSIGTVNIGAIDEYERIEIRYNFLMKQNEDLQNAINILLAIINELDMVMKEDFLKTFKEIEVEFNKVFKELFGGGTALLKLTDPTNVLETGIDIIVTPPGKKISTITLLSGGEKTLTAISLLFSILNIKNIPFCLFDEIEAALDEVNVDKVGTYFSKYKNKTQLIIITHKKKTMEFANTLYGITMQESGVSKLVSVKLVD